jgi:pilus assembly protein CpaF
MRPDRLILGECRGGEVLDLLQALNTGHQGSAATLHANSPREALKRLELLCLLHPASSQSGSLPVRVIRELIAYGLQWIVHLERLPSGKRIIRSVGRIEALEGERILMRSVYEVKL